MASPRTNRSWRIGGAPTCRVLHPVTVAPLARSKRRPAPTFLQLAPIMLLHRHRTNAARSALVGE